MKILTTPWCDTQATQTKGVIMESGAVLTPTTPQGDGVADGGTGPEAV